VIKCISDISSKILLQISNSPVETRTLLKVNLVPSSPG
jgi:hypothetical protein